MKAKSGFTLVELMVAILILLIGVTGILAILPLAFSIQQNSKDVIMSEILARNASAMLSARKIKYSDLRQNMSTADFDVFKPMNPLDYPGSSEFRFDDKDDGHGSGNALLYADTSRMAFPLPNGRVNNYGDLRSQMDAKRVPAANAAYLEILHNHVGQRLDAAGPSIRADLETTFGVSANDSGEMVASITGWARTSSNVGYKISYLTVDPTSGNQVNIVEARDKAVARFWWGNVLPEILYTTGGRNDFDERAQGYGQTSVTGASRDRSRHLWGYNFSQNMMATYEGTGTAPPYLWTIRDRSFPSLSIKRIAKRDYYWVPLLYDADPRPGRFEWRAYVVVSVRFPGRNYKYQAQVHHDHGTSVQAFAANPRDPDSVPRVTAISMEMANSDIGGSNVQRYSGGSYGPLNYVYYPNYPDTSSTATVRARVGRGYMSRQDDWQINGPNDPIGKTNQSHGYVSGRFIPGDKFEITVNQPKITHFRDFSSNGWVLAGSTPTFLMRANNFTGSNNAALRHPVPYWEAHYNPRNSSFRLWTWMSHSNGVGRISVGRIMPVSGQVVDMGN